MRCAVHPDCCRRTTANPHHSPQPPGCHQGPRQARTGRRMIAEPPAYSWPLLRRSIGLCVGSPPTRSFRRPREGSRSLVTTQTCAPSPHRPLRCAGGSARSIAYMYQPQGAVAAGPAPREARGSCSSSQALRLLPIWIPGQQTFEIPPLRRPAPLSAASQKSGTAGRQNHRPGVLL